MWCENLQSRDVDHEVVGWEVVHDIALRLVAKCQVASEGHDQARNHGNASGVVGDAGETVHRWFLQRAVDEEAVVI